jgi:hypothetical protein
MLGFFLPWATIALRYGNCARIPLLFFNNAFNSAEPENVLAG